MIPVEDDLYADNPAPEVIAGRNLRLLRQAHGWSQREVAEKMHGHGYPTWQQSTIGKLESGERPLRVNELAALGAVFGLPAAQLILPFGIPDGYPDTGTFLSDDELPLDVLQEQIARVRKVIGDGEIALEESLSAAVAARREAEAAEAAHAAQRARIEAARARLLTLAGLRDDLLAAEGAS